MKKGRNEEGWIRMKEVKIIKIKDMRKRSERAEMRKKG